MESFVNSRKGGRPLLRVVRKNGYARGTLAYATTERRRGIVGLRPRLCKSGGGPCGGLWHSPAPQPLRFAVPVDRVRQKLPVKEDPPIIKIIVSGGEAVRRRHFSGDNVIVRSGWRRRVPSREMGCATRQLAGRYDLAPVKQTSCVPENPNTSPECIILSHARIIRATINISEANGTNGPPVPLLPIRDHAHARTHISINGHAISHYHLLSYYDFC
ncbi:hypothetical protein GEV33_011557 [Tenebrio molitor]|uniref:Uncharacterized protein n=1 Tax=Tenebrio molitor TaxID=7067 RepID=A0A8J6HCK3_TENMO|nr:hypothetical protein GEV33_011557 [Tenebrio molitor]